ncbi:hypothetical protein LWI29_012006 [Acer saccharum]|uniref:Uncharacterized protein n=1 Tax=Acer saccharum TaxID=4024 RepID=A0AA39S3K3_ACESA|nr:hypothetical protein LWI29_012006 [Acer saccharum]
MMFGKILLFLVLVTTTAIGAAMAKNTYIIHMDKTKMGANLFRLGDSMQTYQAVIDSINKISLQEDDQEQQAELVYAYETAISGFAAKLSTKQLESLEKVDGFLSATPGKMLQLHTTNSQQFLGLQNGKGLLSASNSASDVIIGFLDTGISPEHVSFKDTGMPAVPSRWKGVCEEGTKFSKSNCNKKLIGARFFFKGYEAHYGRINETNEFLSARDNQGHVIKLGNGKVVEGVSLYSGDALTKPVPVAYLESTGIPASKFCLGTLNESLVEGKIVVCHGDNVFNPYLKSENVKKAKGVGMILVNPKFYGDELTANPHILPTAEVGYTADVASSNLAGPFDYGSGHVDPERAVDPGLIYDIAAQDYLNYLCSLNYTSSDIGLFTDGTFTCPQNIAFRAGDLNYPSFAFNFKGGVQNGSLEYKRTVTNVGIPTSSYAVQVEVPEGVSVIVKPKILSFNKLGQKLSYKVTVVGKSKTSSHSSFGSLTWVSGKFRVRSPIAVTWQ